MSNKKENAPPSGRAPREAPPPAPEPGNVSSGLVERPQHLQNVPPSALSSAGASQKPEVPSQPSAGQSAAADLEQTESITYQVLSDGYRRQYVLVPPNHPDYEQPMDLTIPAHWTTWTKITYDRPGEFEEAAGLVEEAYNEARLILSPVLAGGVSAVQAFQPGTNEPSEPYMEVRVRQRDMDRWPEALKAVKDLIAQHMPAQFQGVRIRFNFTRGVAFSAFPDTPARPKATPVSKATPAAAQQTLRQKYKQEMDQALNTPQSIRNAYGDGARPLTTAERAKTVIWREDKACNLGKTTPVGMSLGIKDGRLKDPKYGSGACGPKFRVKNLSTGDFEKYDDGTDAFFVSGCHHSMHQKADRAALLPDQLPLPEGPLVVTHPTRRDWEATVFSRQDRDATYAHELRRHDLDQAARKAIEQTREYDLRYTKENDPQAIGIGEIFLTSGQEAAHFTKDECGPHLEYVKRRPYISDFALIKLKKEIADQFDNVFPSNMPIPRGFAADFDKFRTRPHITGMADLKPASEPLLIKVGRTTEISVGRVGASRQEHSINESDDSIPETHDYAVFPVQAGRAVGYFGDSGAGLYTSDGKLSAILVAGDDSNMLETPVYIMPIQLVQARMRQMGYELDICPPGIKAEIRLDNADKYGTIKSSSKKNRNKLEKERKAEEKKLEMQASARQTEEARIAKEAAPDGTNGVVLGIDSNGVDEKPVYRVRLSPTGDVKCYPSSMLGLTWQPAVQAFWATVREDQRMSAVATGVSSLQLTGKKGKEKKK